MHHLADLVLYGPLLDGGFRSFVIDLLLPKTDRMVFIQWGVCAAFWLPIIFFTRKLDRDYRHFIWGLAMVNLAWFAARTVH